jgi:hypothetical protein
LRALQRPRSLANLRNVAKNDGSCRTTMDVAHPGWKVNGWNMARTSLDPDVTTLERGARSGIDPHHAPAL